MSEPARITPYIAAAWSAAPVLRELLDELNAQEGAEVGPIHWVESQRDGMPGFPTDPKVCNVEVQDIMRRMQACDGLIVWNAWPSTRGGLHVEFGMALALGKPIILLGEPMNMFQNSEYAHTVNDTTARGLRAAVEILIGYRDYKKLESKE